MEILDVVLGTLLAFAIYKGIKNGLFVELASLLSLIVGIFVAIKFSYIISETLVAIVSWNPRYIKVTAFALTFIAVVVGIHLLAKFFTSIVDFAYLGWLNKLAGALFSVLKTILALSVVFTIFQKINLNNLIVKKETLDTSIFYSPIQDISQFIYPTLKEWYFDFKNNEDKSE